MKEMLLLDIDNRKSENSRHDPRSNDDNLLKHQEVFRQQHEHKQLQ